MSHDTLNLINDLITQAKSLGADAADAVSFISDDVSVAVRNGKLETIERSESQGFGLRVMVGKRKAIVSSDDTHPDTLKEMVSRAVDMAKLSPEDPYTSLANESQFPASLAELDLYDANEPDEESLTKQATDAESTALAVEGITNTDCSEASYGRSTIALATVMVSVSVSTMVVFMVVSISIPFPVLSCSMRLFFLSTPASILFPMVTDLYV